MSAVVTCRWCQELGWRHGLFAAWRADSMANPVSRADSREVVLSRDRLGDSWRQGPVHGHGGRASKALSRRRPTTRLGLLVAVLPVPTIVATWWFVGILGTQVPFCANEPDGVTVLGPARTALTATVVGDVPDLAAVRSAVPAEPGLGLTASMDAVHAVAAGAATPGSRGRLASALVDLITATGNNSNLLLDPDSFDVMNAIVAQAPTALLMAGQAAVPPSGTPEQQVAAQAVLAGVPTVRRPQCCPIGRSPRRTPRTARWRRTPRAWRPLQRR